MFGTNQIVGSAFFKDAPAESLMVTSIFYTIQGEGPYSGLPAVFVRLSKCNLNCKMCDALFEQGEYMTFYEILRKAYGVVCDHWNSKALPIPKWILSGHDTYTMNCGLVVTGGEPSIQPNVSAFINSMNNHFDWVQTESNGIQRLDVETRTVQVVSPKCLEKDGVATRYLKPNQQVLDAAAALKFVVSADQDSPYSSVPDWAHEWAASTGRDVYISPMNVYKSIPQRMKLMIDKTKTLEQRSTVDEVVSFWEDGVLDREANRRNHEYAAQYAMTNGFRFQVQAHLLASLA